MADRVAVLKDGRLLQIAAPHVLYERPACRAVAEFVGLSTLLPGRVAAPDRVDVGFARLATATGARAPGRAVHVLVRPEHVEADPPPGAPNRLEGRVGAVRYLGAVTRYDFEVRGVRALSRARQPAGRRRHRHRSRAYLPAGRLIPFHLPLKELHDATQTIHPGRRRLPLAALARRAAPWAVPSYMPARRRCTKRRARKDVRLFRYRTGMGQLEGAVPRIQATLSGHRADLQRPGVRRHGGGA